MFKRLTGTHALIGRLLYGTGLRLLEGLRLRVKDLDFVRGQIVAREGKGNKDRVTMLPEAVRETLKVHLHRVRALHEKDLAAGLGEVWLPKALAVAWQWVFPSAELSTAASLTWWRRLLPPSGSMWRRRKSIPM